MRCQFADQLAFFILYSLGSFRPKTTPPPQVIQDSVKLTIKINHHSVEDGLNSWAENGPQE